MKNYFYVAVVKGTSHNLSGVWGPFYTEDYLRFFMESKGMPKESYDVYFINRPN